MDVAVIDWKDSKFVKDDVLESINAPQWVDFSAPDQSVDDESWFCRPDCNHPKTIDDFLKKTPTTKLQRSASVSEILPFGDRTRREAALKKRGLAHPSISSNKESKTDRLVEEGENQNPNLLAPLKYKAKLAKEIIKSSTEKKKQFDSVSHKDEKQKLKSTLSARNLFAGRDILNQITDFCSELKKLALRAKEREIVEKEISNNSPVAVNKQEVKECLVSKPRIVLDERKPLLEVSKEKYEAFEKNNVKEKLRKIRNEEAENSPIRVDLKFIGGKEGNLAQIRTNPPSPQCFSAKRVITKPAATPTTFKPRTQERGGIHQELEQRKDARKEEAVDNKATPGRIVPLPAEREPAKTLDVFWFLKPCTFAS